MSEEFCFITEKIQLLFMLFLSCRKRIDLLQDNLLIVLYLHDFWSANTQLQIEAIRSCGPTQKTLTMLS